MEDGLHVRACPQRCPPPPGQGSGVPRTNPAARVSPGCVSNGLRRGRHSQSVCHQSQGGERKGPSGRSFENTDNCVSQVGLIKDSQILQRFSSHFLGIRSKQIRHSARAFLVCLRGPGQVKTPSLTPGPPSPHATVTDRLPRSVTLETALLPLPSLAPPDFCPFHLVVTKRITFRFCPET